MKKKICIIITLIIYISSLVSCEPEPHKFLSVDTDLGDHLTFEFYRSGNMHGMYFTYNISSEGITGGAHGWNKEIEEIPEDPLETFETIGEYGNTHFYSLDGNVFFIYNNELLDDYWYTTNLSDYLLMSEVYSDDVNKCLLNSISDLMKTGRFEYIHQYGEILTYEKDDAIKSLLERYATSEFTEEERDVNKNSSLTEYDMTEWAKGLLETYYVE